jgi:ribosomal protein L2
MLSSFLLNTSKFKLLKTGFVNRCGVDFRGRKVARFKGGSSTKHSLVSLDLQRIFLPHKALVLNIIKVYKKTCLVALLKFATGSYSYVLSPWGLEPGCFIKTVFRPIEFTKKYQLGYLVLLRYLMPHTMVFGLEIKVGGGSKYALAAGTKVLILVTDEITNHVLVELPTGAKL